MFSVKSPNNYLQGSDLLQQVGEHIRPLADHVCILTSPQAWQAVNPALSNSLKLSGIGWQLEYMTGECSDRAIAQFHKQIANQEVNGILAIGGGRVLDTAKAAHRAFPHLPLITLPTVAATCAAWSPLAIIYNDVGAHQRSDIIEMTPALVLVDSQVIAHSNVRYLQAGIIDSLAKWYEFAPWQRHYPHQLAVDIKVPIARLAVDIIINFGQQAVLSNQQGQVTPALEKVIEANIALAGLANSVRGELNTPGLAHIIHDALTHQPEMHIWLHGEKVGFSLLIQSLIVNGNSQADSELITLLRQFGSPLRLPDLQGNRRQRIDQIVDEAMLSIREHDNLPFTVTRDILLQALLATEQYDFRVER